MFDPCTAFYIRDCLLGNGSTTVECNITDKSAVEVSVAKVHWSGRYHQFGEFVPDHMELLKIIYKLDCWKAARFKDKSNKRHSKSLCHSCKASQQYNATSVWDEKLFDIWNFDIDIFDIDIWHLLTLKFQILTLINEVLTFDIWYFVTLASDIFWHWHFKFWHWRMKFR